MDRYLQVNISIRTTARITNTTKTTSTTTTKKATTSRTYRRRRDNPELIVAIILPTLLSPFILICGTCAVCYWCSMCMKKRFRNGVLIAKCACSSCKYKKPRH